jgi:hypothetical protein
VFSARVVPLSDSDIAVLIGLCQQYKVELYADAMAQGWKPPVEESGERVNQPGEPG